MPEALWYLSFVDPDLAEGWPGGPGWLGAAIVPGANEIEAVLMAWSLDCNPGGEVAMWGPFPVNAVKPEYVGRLLDRDEIELAGV